MHSERPCNLAECGFAVFEGLPDGAFLEDCSEAFGFDFDAGCCFFAPVGDWASDDGSRYPICCGVGEEDSA